MSSFKQAVLTWPPSWLPSHICFFANTVHLTNPCSLICLVITSCFVFPKAAFLGGCCRNELWTMYVSSNMPNVFYNVEFSCTAKRKRTGGEAALNKWRDVWGGLCRISLAVEDNWLAASQSANPYLAHFFLSLSLSFSLSSLCMFWSPFFFGILCSRKMDLYSLFLTSWLSPSLSFSLTRSLCQCIVLVMMNRGVNVVVYSVLRWLLMVDTCAVCNI